MKNINLLFYFFILLLGCDKTQQTTKHHSEDSLKEIIPYKKKGFTD